MSSQHHNEKEEEKREKEDEKSSEKTWDEKWRHNPVRMVTLAFILIWGGIVAFIDSAHLVKTAWWESGPIFLIGTGIILLLKSVYRLLPEHRRPVGGTVIISVVLIAVGLGDLISWNYTWPIVLVAIGLVIVLGTLLRRK